MHCKSQLEMKGSHFIIAQCKEGIMVLTESRASIYDRANPNEILAYHDSAQKSYIIGKNVLVMNGKNLLSRFYFKFIIDKFEASMNNTISAFELLSTFLDSCKKNLNELNYNWVMQSFIATAGYENGKPIVCFYNPHIGKPQCYDDLTWLEPVKTSFFLHYNQEFSWKELQKNAASCISEYAQKDGKEKSIGGLIRVILVTKDDATWVQNEPILKFDTSIDFIKAYKNNQVEIHFIVEGAKAKVDSMFEDVLKSQ